MRYQYVVTLRRDNEKAVDIISFFLCLLSILAFVFQQINTRKFDAVFTFAALLVTVGLVYNFVSSKNGKQVRFKNWLLISGVFWLGMPYLQWMSAVFFILAFLEYQAKYPLEVGFSNEMVVINTLIKRKIPWSRFNNVMLKDGLLTLDFKNNKLFQKEALDDEEDDADEDEFNDYCKARLLNSNQNTVMIQS